MYARKNWSMLMTSAETTVNWTIIRICGGIKFRINEMTTFDPAVTNVKPNDMTMAAFNCVVTANAEQIPRI